MKSRIFVLLALFLSTIALGGPLAPSVWLVSMEGHYLTWILRIPQTDAATGNMIDATYSNTVDDATRRPISGSVSATIVTYTTPSGATVTVTQHPDGSFIGTLISKKGGAKKVAMRAISETEIPGITAAEREAQARKAIAPPTADVPAACAQFSGEWQGQWSTGGYGLLYLWVEKIEPNCMATIRYSDKPKRGKTTLDVQIEDGKFSFVCNQSTGGTCVISRNGDGLYANYSNPQGGRNNAALTAARQ